MNKVNERKLAVKILTAITYQGAYLGDELALRTKEVDSAQKGYIYRVVHGVIEHKSYLDGLMQSQSKIKLKKMRESDLNILRLALYEMLHMDSVPRYASVNEAIRLMKKANMPLVRFANGLLRNFSNNLDKLKEDFEQTAGLDILHSHPQWLVERLTEEVGAEEIEALLAANNLRPDLSLRVNTLKADREKVLEDLRSLGFDVRPSEAAPEGIVVIKSGDQNLFETALFREGRITVQDQSSMMVGHILDPKPGERVLDLCAAPGGKTTHLAQLLQDQGQIDARDVSYEKLYLIQENLERLGIGSVSLALGDALVLDPQSVEAYDRVLLDAPCSGYGIIRRKPDIKWQRTEEDSAQLSEIQANMLENASKYVKIGGVVVYSTCTITERENESVIRAFLDSHPEFVMDTLDEIDQRYITGGQLKILPHIHGMDGFFACRLKRIK